MLKITDKIMRKNEIQLNDERLRIAEQLKTETNNETIRKLKIRMVSINYKLNLSISGRTSGELT